MTMTNRERRGTKLRCHNNDCGLPFYDLNRANITCPNCGATYVPPVVEPPSKSARRNFYPKPNRPMLATVPEASDEPAADLIENDLEVAEEDIEGDTEATAPGVSILVPDELDADPEVDIAIEAPHGPLKDD